MTVLEVSIVDHWAADPYLVTETPNELKHATDSTEQYPKKRMLGLLMNCLTARAVSSSHPYLQNRAELQGMNWTVVKNIA
mgnify:CR=1 FL=1